ncbi:MAG: MFS transporter [Acidobacteria bacterium]|nr:MFS transporter [Acidobacteriota bacterium]
MTAGPDRRRWLVALLLFGATALSYLDRQALSVVAPFVRDDLHITTQQYGYAVGSFLGAYTVMHVVSGRFVDVAGSRAGLAWAVAWWSVAAMLHGLSRGIGGLCLFRFLLGMGEAAGYPASIKCVREWFAASERALATGLFNTGAAAGAIVAPPLIAWITTSAGWRVAFVATGALGLVWVTVWLMFHAGPLARRVSYDSAAEQPVSLASLITQRPVWGLCLARFLTDPVWYFYLFWLPTYLKDVRHFSLTEVGYFAWIPFLTADLGSVAGGAFSSTLMRRGVPLFRARHIAMLSSALLMPAALFAVRAENPAAAVAWISLATFGHQSWSSNSLTLPADLVTSSRVASVYGLSGGAGALAGTLVSFGLGHVVSQLSYAPVFTVAALLHPLAALAVIATVRSPCSEPPERRKVK